MFEAMKDMRAEGRQIEMRVPQMEAKESANSRSTYGS
jgi:hypothetical protein